MMGLDRVSTGSSVLDDLLDGGLEKGVVTTVYGPAGSGKTNACLISMAAVAPGNKVIFIDTEGGFSVDRLRQIDPRYQEYKDNILIFKPTTFEEQKKVFTKLRELVNNREIGMVVVDSIAMLYRLELGKSHDVYNTNKELGIQIAELTELARKNMIPILLTNQVYSNFEEADKVNMVGGDILKYGSKCLVELEKAQGQARIATIRKHRSLPEGKEVAFTIKEEGFERFALDNPQHEQDLRNSP